MTAPVQVPADVEREDRILGPLTARQVLVVACAGAATYTLWRAIGPGRPVLFVLAALPVALLATALVVGRRDGLALDRLLTAALRQRAALPTARPSVTPGSLRRPGPGVPGAPPAAAQVGSGRLVSPRPVLRGVRAAGSDRLGIAELGGSGSAVVCSVSPVNLSLRSAGEQHAAVSGFARWLHSLSGPVQLLTRTRPLDLTGPITRLHTAADRLGNPALARAALGHAAHLHALDAHAELLHREFLIVFRDPTPTGRGPRSAAASAEALRRRAGEAAALLGPLGLRVTPLTDTDTAHTLRRATAPATGLHPDPDTRQNAGQAAGHNRGNGTGQHLTAPEVRAARHGAGDGCADSDPPTVELPAVPAWTPRPPGTRSPGQNVPYGSHASHDDVGLDPTALGDPHPERTPR